MIYTNKKGRTKKPVKITREDIEKAMREFDGEIQRIKSGGESSRKSNPTQVGNPFGTLFVNGDYR